MYFKTACFALMTALMATTSAAAQSRSGTHISKQVQVMKNMLDSYVASQTALNAAQDNQINALTAEINSMNACSTNSMVYAPSNPSSDADGCFRLSTGSVAQGRITRPLEYVPYNGSVTFDTPYSVVPTVTYSITGYAGSGGCRGYNVDLRMGITNVTRTGFDYSMAGYNGGCGRLSIYDAVWFASEDPVQVSGPISCPTATYSGATFPSRTAGTTHSETLRGSCPSRGGQITTTNSRIVTGTCRLSTDGETAAWGAFSSRQVCNYREER